MACPVVTSIFLYDSYEAAGNGTHGDIGGLIKDDQTPLGG